MADENDFLTPEPESSQFNHERSSEESHGSSDAIEKEWRQITAAYAHQEFFPEWENVGPASLGAVIPLPIQDKEKQVHQVKRLISHCRRNAMPIAWEILQATDQENFEFNPKAAVEQLFTEFESVLHGAETEASEVESGALGTHEFESELSVTDQAHELALTEILAAESTHSGMESEAQSLLATALPITISIMGGASGLKRILPALTQANAKLTGAMYYAEQLPKAALSLVPTIQRRVISGIKAINDTNQALTSDLVHRLVAAQAASVLSKPNVIGRAMIRNRAIRMNTMSPCSQNMPNR